MDPQRWQRLQEMFLAAWNLPADERAGFLADTCGDDAEFLGEIESLLAAAAAPDSPTGPPTWLGEAAAAAAGDALVGRRLGPYEVRERLGAGGTATVYLAERIDGQFDQEVAIKVLRREHDAGPLLGRFLDERRILAQLTHPNIARIFDGGLTGDGRPYFVLEHVAGLPLDVYCDDRCAGVEQRLRLFLEVCDAVRHAHGRLIVHRDLKPSNILVDAEGRVKLLDFGIAKLLDDDDDAAAPRTVTRAQVMTPQYASPEQIAGEPVTVATDVYALGLILFELLTGRRAYDLTGLTPAAAEKIVRDSDPAPPSRAATEQDPSGKPPWIARGVTREHLGRMLRGDLDTIVMKALRKDIERRYSSVQDLADDIERYLTGMPVRARPATARYRLRKFARRHRTAVVAGVLVVAALVSGIAGTTWQAARAGREARQAARERDRAVTAAAQAAQVTAFLVDLFRAADPYAAGADSLSPRTLLDRGRRRVEEELAGQPAAQAALWTAMGLAYRNLGHPAVADSLVSRGLAVLRVLDPGDDSVLAETIDELGMIRLDQGDATSARALFREGLTLRRRHLQPPAGPLAASLNNIGTCYMTEGQADSAAAYFAQAVAMRRGLPDDEPAELALNLGNLAVALGRQRRFAEADSLMREVIALQRRYRGADHPETAATLDNLGVMRYRAGDLPGAESCLTESLDIRRRVLGPDHPLTGKSLNNLAAVLERSGDPARAEPLYREALAVKRARLGDDHPSVVTSVGNLGLVLMALERYDEAEPMLRRVVDARRSAMGPRHVRVAGGLFNLGRLFEARGEFPAATAAFADAWGIFREALGQDHERTRASAEARDRTAAAAARKGED